MVPPEVVGGLATTEGKATWSGKVGGKVVDAGTGDTAAGPILWPKMAMISRGETAEPPSSTGSNFGVPFQIADFWLLAALRIPLICGTVPSVTVKGLESVCGFGLVSVLGLATVSVKVAGVVRLMGLSVTCSTWRLSRVGARAGSGAAPSCASCTDELLKKFSP